MSDSPLPHLPKRETESHKGDYGRALLVGGSRGMSGAISLAGMSTLRSGAGLVTLAVPDVCLETVALFEPSYMTLPMPCDERGRMTFAARYELDGVVASATAIACGPGWGQTEGVGQLAQRLYLKAAVPGVFDADALNGLAATGSTLRHHAAPRILTPHPGEFDRLVGESLSTDQREARAVQLAKDNEVVVVLKGHHTLVTDGESQFRNTTGNPGMATGGCGDVLTGIITALLCQGLTPLDAARLGVHVHGLAGDLAAEEVGQVSLIASDLLATLPEAFAEVQSH